MARQHAPTAGDAGDGKAEMRGSSQGGAVVASSARARKAESETRSSSQAGAVDASWAPIRGGRKRPQRSINFQHRPRER